MWDGHCLGALNRCMGRTRTGTQSRTDAADEPKFEVRLRTNAAGSGPEEDCLWRSLGRAFAQRKGVRVRADDGIRRAVQGLDGRPSVRGVGAKADGGDLDVEHCWGGLCGTGSGGSGGVFEGTMRVVRLLYLYYASG